ncbi:MAG TPA: hypothetical protein VEZ20_08575 [Allosphingosinicella sp.]|nr:hypothetical protein [Allosphingosinicella sp.]
MVRRAVLALAAAVLIAGCGEASVPAANDAATAKAPARSPAVTPVTIAQRMVRQQLGPSGDVRFGAARIYTSGGIAIVCGSYAPQGQGEQRFVAVGDVDVWLEPNMAPGEMDRAFAQYCRDGAANA